MRWGDARGRLRDDTNDGAHLKALPGRRGWRRRRVGRWDLRGRRGRRRGHRGRFRGLNGAGRKEEAGRKDAQVDGGCRRRGSYRGRRAALSLGLLDEHRPLLDGDRRTEESKLVFFGKQVEAFTASWDLPSTLCTSFYRTTPACVVSHQGSTARTNPVAWGRPRCFSRTIKSTTVRGRRRESSKRVSLESERPRSWWICALT